MIWKLSLAAAVLLTLFGSAEGAEVSLCTPNHSSMVEKMAELGEKPITTWAETWRRGQPNEYVLFKTLFGREDGTSWTMTMSGASSGVCTMRSGVGVTVHE